MSNATIKVSIVIASHLSDVQMEMGSGNKELQAQANTRINFVKALVNLFSNTDQEVSTSSLDIIWKKTKENYG